MFSRLVQSWALAETSIIKSCAAETPRLGAGEEAAPSFRVLPLAGAGFERTGNLCPTLGTPGQSRGEMTLRGCPAG